MVWKKEKKWQARENRTVLFTTEKGNLATALFVRLCMNFVLFSFVWFYTHVLATKENVA